jgi:hypothetical protein
MCALAAAFVSRPLPSSCLWIPIPGVTQIPNPLSVHLLNRAILLWVMGAWRHCETKRALSRSARFMSGSGIGSSDELAQQATGRIQEFAPPGIVALVAVRRARPGDVIGHRIAHDQLSDDDSLWQPASAVDLTTLGRE